LAGGRRTRARICRTRICVLFATGAPNKALRYIEPETMNRKTRFFFVYVRTDPLPFEDDS
jgi:hypothetical protein